MNSTFLHSGFSALLNKKRGYFLIFLFIASLVFRFPTLFNDYYDVDELAAIVQTHEYFSGAVPGKDFQESKLPVYHALFKFSYSISEQNGWIIVHACTILIVFLTGLFVYLIGGRLFSLPVGSLAGLLYVILISSFNRNFMATNGEIVFNLPVIAGSYFFILFLTGKDKMKYLMLLVSIGMGILSAFVKVQGAILLVFFVFFTILYYPFYIEKASAKYWSILIIIASTFICGLIIDYNMNNYIAENILGSLYGKLDYMAASGSNPIYFFIRFAHRQGMLFLWHFIIWMPIVIYLGLFIKKRFKAATLEESSLAVLFVLTYLMTFAGGARLYFHYYMAAYPALSILAACVICNSEVKIIEHIRKKIALFVLVPSLFFLVWNIKDVIIKHYFPVAFYQEGRVLYWTRAVLVGSLNHYLLPGDSYRNACAYIKKNTEKDARVFVWGDGPYVHYFSQRRMGNKHLWPKIAAHIITELYRRNDRASREKAFLHEEHFINVLKEKKPLLFVDTSKNGLTGFTYPVSPGIRKYLDKHYRFIKEIDKMMIYRRK